MSKIQSTIELSLSSGLLFDGRYYSYKEIYDTCFGLSQGSIRVILNRLKDQGRLEKIVKNGRVYFRLSAFEIRHLKKSFRLELDKEKRWDGLWSIVIIPNAFYRKKEMQNKLKELGFGMMQKAVYISPYRWKDKEMVSKVWRFEAKTFSPPPPQVLASTIWNLDSLYTAYIIWMGKVRNYRPIKRRTEIEQFADLIAQYESILRNDPVLPNELLLANWPARAAQKLFITLVQKKFAYKLIGSGKR